MKLRTAALVALVALVGAVVLAMVLAVSTVINRAAERDVRNELVRAGEVLRDVLTYRRADLANDARLVADEPRIRALVAGDVDVATIRGGALCAQERLGTQIFMLTDEDGYLLVDVEYPEDTGANLLESDVVGPLIEAARNDGLGSGIWTKGQEVYRVQSQQIQIGKDTRDIVIIGFGIGDQEALILERQLGAAVVLSLDDRVVAASPSAPLKSGQKTTVPNNADPTEVVLGGQTYMAINSPLPGYAGQRKLRITLLEDLERALEPGRRMQRVLYLVFGIAVVVAIGLAFLLSHRLSRPLDELVAFTRTIGEGRLDARTDVGGLAEVKTLGSAMNRMVSELDQSRKELVEKERLENELEIARAIQTSILPPDPALRCFEIAAAMVTADEVGGDYYDVIPTPAGGWIAIGDACGHGLDAGLIMMMVQTSVATLVRADPSASPSAVIEAINRVIYDNVRNRLGELRHMTLSLLRVDDAGNIDVAGAHMDILIRRKDGTIEEVATPGTWIGIADDISSVTVDSRVSLEDGDLVVVYTDGVTEATNAAGELYGLERLGAVVRERGDEEPAAVVAAILEATDSWQEELLDDVTVLAARWRRPS